VSGSRIIRPSAFVFSRARGFNRQVSVSPKAECSIYQRQLVPAIEAELLQQDAAVL
jgi:hypothetical protein